MKYCLFFLFYFIFCSSSIRAQVVSLQKTAKITEPIKSSIKNDSQSIKISTLVSGARNAVIIEVKENSTKDSLYVNEKASSNLRKPE